MIYTNIEEPLNINNGLSLELHVYIDIYLGPFSATSMSFISIFSRLNMTEMMLVGL